MRRVLAGAIVGLFVAVGAERCLAEQGANEGYRRTLEKYAIPDVTLVNQDGAKVRLQEVLDPSRAVIVSFFFTSCTTICPVLSASFASLQERLGSAAHDVRLVSIAIDPEYDTPEALRSYRERFGGAPGWVFLTGSRDDIDRVTKAFEAYVPNKMAHRALSFLRSPGGTTWVRLDGLVSASDIAREFSRFAAR